MSTSSPLTAARKPAPCRFHIQGRCRAGDSCKYSHEVDIQSTGKDTHSDQSQIRDSPSSRVLNTPSHDSAAPRTKPKHGQDVCRAWKSGTCIKGSKCRFRHDINEVEPHKQIPSASSRPATLGADKGPTGSPAASGERAQRKAEHIRAQKAAAEAVARERADAIAREEAAKTTSQVVFGSVVTYSAGLDVSKLITGFETCTIRFANLPPDVKEEDVHALLRDQGINTETLHLVLKKSSNHGPEVHILADIASGQAIASLLDDIEFRDEPLVVEISAANSLDGMDATAGQGSDVLTISWRAPSARYVAEYVDVPTAKAKVAELNRFIYDGRRIRVEMNSHPPGYVIPNLRLNAIKLNNLPPDIMDQDIIKLTKARAAKRLRIKGTFTGAFTVEQVARLVRNDIEQAVPEGLLRFEDPPSTCNLEGIVSARAYFSSWDEAHTAYTRLSGQRYNQQAIWLRLPNPMHYTLVIPIEQYRAQKAQWNSLLESTKDQQACILNIRDSGNVVRVQLSGSVKEATGAMKVRVENLARGEKVEGWHRSLANSGNPFVFRVYSETGAYLRVDLQRESLKVYGAPKPVDQAREMIKNELERLASLDHTITLPQMSVGFFVREGIQQLKETLGEDNVKFATSSRKVTVSGGEEARHALDRLIKLSLNGKSTIPNTRRGNQTCPICYDDISSPHQLGCGHTYCVACLRHYISSAFESDQLPLLCLGDEAQCHVPIAIPTIQHFVPPATFNRLLEAAFNTYIAKHPEQLKHCKTPDCTQIYRAAQTGATPQTLHCPSCFSAVCNACHDDAHDGLTCAQCRETRRPLEQARMDAWIASQGGRVKKCPQCTVPIEKIEGCNHVTCRCGAHICWECLGVYTDRGIYVHMNEVHGAIYEEDPDVPRRAPMAQNVGEHEGGAPTEQGWEERAGFAEEQERQQRVAEERHLLLEQYRREEAEAEERRRAEQRRQQLAEEQRRVWEQFRRQEAETEERRLAEQRRVREQFRRQEAEAAERRLAEQRRQQDTEERRRRVAEWERQVAEERRRREVVEQRRRAVTEEQARQRFRTEWERNEVRRKQRSEGKSWLNYLWSWFE